MKKLINIILKRTRNERALRIAYGDYTPSFKDLLTRDGTVTVHHRNLIVLGIEQYKTSHDQSPKFMKTWSKK